LIVCLVLLPGLARAQSADQVLKRAVKALGGEKALRRIASRQSAGAIRRRTDGATGRFQSATLAPDLYTATIEIGGFEASEGYNGKSAWRRDSRAGLRTLTGAESVDFRAEAVYRNRRWLDYKKEKAKIVLDGEKEVAGRRAIAVSLTTARNARIRIFFDPSTYLPLREELGSGDGAKVYEYSDYRSVDGLPEPHSILIAAGGDEYEIALETVTHQRAGAPADRARFDFPRFSNEPLPDIPALLAEVDRHQQAIEELLEKYAFTQEVASREMDRSGQLRIKETETFEMTFYRGRRLRRQVARNGQPLSAEELAKEDRRIEKLVREIEKREAERAEQSGRVGPPDEAGKPPTIADVLRASLLLNPRRERFRSREVIVFDFEPRPGYKPQKDFEKLFGKLAGAIWIDDRDRQVVRVEARLVDSFKIGGGLLGAIKPGAAFVIEQNRVNDEIWLPTYAEFNLAARALFIGFNFNSLITYRDYKRFHVEAEKEKLKDPVKP
jgi:hypothetical protein